MKRILALLMTMLLISSIAPMALAEDKPTVLTVGSVNADYKWKEMEVFQDLEKKLNIDIQFTLYSMDNFSVMLADGNLPDIMLSRQQYLSNVLESGLALNITPYIDEYMPNLKNPLYASTLELQRAAFPGEEEDGIYFLCPVVGLQYAEGGTDQFRGYIVRWDYYKELGCPEIKNDEDYFNVLIQMQQNHPYTEDGKPTYAFGVANSLKNMGGYRASWLTDVAVNLWGSYNYKGSLIDNTLVNNYTDVEHSSYWTDMKFYNKIYRAGLFDPDTFIMSYDEYDAKVAEGRYMGLYYNDNTFYENQAAIDPNTLSGYVVIPSEGAILYADGVWLLGNAPVYHGFINAKSENKITAMRFYNEIYDPDFTRTWYSGKQGVHWDYDENGEPYVFPETLEMIANNSDEFTGKGYGYHDPYITAYSSNSIHPDGHMMNLVEEDREAKIASQNPLQLDYAAHYGVEYWIDAMYNTMENMSHDFNDTISGNFSDTPTEIKRTLSMCDDVLYNAMPSLVMAESDEEFADVQQEVMEQLEELNEAEIWEWYSAKWNAARDVISPLFEAAREDLLPKK